MKIFDKKIIGVFYLLLSTLLYGLIGVFSRFISNFSPFSQGWVKATITLSIIVFVFIISKSHWKKIRGKDIKWFAVWILPASVQPVLTFLAFNHLPIGVVYFLNYSTMILGGIISGRFFFREKINLSKLISLVCVFTGLFLIYGSNISFAKNIYVFYALFAGLILGFWNTLTKKVSEHYSEIQMMSLDNGTSLIICLLVSLFLGEKLPQFSGSWLWIFAFAGTLTLAAFFLIRGFKNVEAQVGSLIMPMEILFGAFFGYLFFGEILKQNMYLGGFFILLGAILPAISIKNKSDIIPS
jgi:drug/metabolite transporter (DMT)-like permease